MFGIKHTICPSCSVGCGLNIISKEGSVVGTYPYKRHPINEGKNCINGRDSILKLGNRINQPSLIKNNELIGSTNEEVLGLIKEQLSSIKANELGIICSGKNTNEEIVAIKEFADKFGTENIGFYGYNFPNVDIETASYDDVTNAESILTIGDVIKENPLLGRRIFLAKSNGAKLISMDNIDKSITINNSDEFVKFTDCDFISELSNVKDKLSGDSVILINKIGNKEDFGELVEFAKETGAKLLPILKESNSKGAMNVLNSLNVEEIIDLIEASKVLIVVNDNLLDYLSEKDIKNKCFIINISNYEDEFTKLSDVVLPGKPWIAKEGSFTNNEGLKQEFLVSAEVDDDNLSELEIFNEFA